MADGNPELWVENSYPHLRPGPRLAVLLGSDGHALTSAEVGADGRATFEIPGRAMASAWVAQSADGHDLMVMPVNQSLAAGTFTIDTRMEQS